MATVANVANNALEVAQNVGLREKVLWTNPNVNSEFIPQTVNLSDDVSKYKLVCIDFIVTIVIPRKFSVVFSVRNRPTSGNNTMYANGWTNNTGFKPVNRDFGFETNTTCFFGAGHQEYQNADANGCAVPVSIIAFG